MITIGWLVPILRSEAQTEHEMREMISQVIDGQCNKRSPPSNNTLFGLGENF